MDLKILYEDKNFIAINKPAGILVHPTNISKEKTLVDFLFKKYPEIKKVGDDPENRPGVVHRLDKDTSGAIVIARNQKYFEYLKKLFQNHEIKKTYIALVWDKVDPPAGGAKGIINKPIGIKPGTIKHTVHGGRMIKEAVTEYEVVKNLKLEMENGKEEIFSLVKVMPQTGRTHQIRVHFAAIHHSIIGDPIYGKKGNPFGLERQFLHAQSLEFNIDENKKVKIEADLSDDLKNILNQLEVI